MQPHLIIRKGEKNYLLVRSCEQIHLITVDRRLTKNVEDWLLEQPRNVEEMNKRQLSRSSIELKNLCGISMTSLEAGGYLQLYLKDGKRRYQFSVDCTEADIDALFQGIARFASPKPPINWEAWENVRDWRTPRQDPALRNKLQIMGGAVNVIGFISGWIVMIAGYTWTWIIVVCLCCLIGTFLLFGLYPEYYTIFEDKKSFGKKKFFGIYFPVLMCPTALIVAALMHYHVFSWLKAWMIGAVVVVFLAVFFRKRSPEFLNPARIAGFVLVGILISPGPVLAVNFLLDFAQAQEIRTDVVDTEHSHSGRGGDSYYISVELDGDVVSFPVYRSTFEQTQVGDRVSVDLYSGALGIPYARIE